MKQFWVDYSASILIEAETAEEAISIFWQSEKEEIGRMSDFYEANAVEEKDNNYYKD